MSRETFRLNTRPLSLTRYPEYPLTFRHSSFSVMFSSLVFGSTLKPYGGRYSLSSYRWAHFVWALLSVKLQVGAFRVGAFRVGAFRVGARTY